jgi:hypothetical protein
MIFEEKQKSQPISKRQVWDAFKAVKSNDGSAGVDNIDIVEIERLRGNICIPYGTVCQAAVICPYLFVGFLSTKKTGANVHWASPLF